ncbi:MAG: methyltransferase domain-containing protein [Desulfovibrionaceae bacterium]|nr:methyltransferase domain-containing protein [Desulfovibrionaceae bacterium]
MNDEAGESIIHLEKCPGCGYSERIPVYAIAWERSIPVAVCARCALTYQEAPLNAAELERYYRTNSIYHFHGPGSRQHKLVGARHAFLAGLLPSQDRHRCVLDVGCGFGDFLASFDPSAWRRMGIELNAERAAFGRESLGLEIIERPLESPGIEPGSVDLLCAFGVIEHMYDLPTVFASMHSCLAMGGLGVVNVADIDKPDHGVSDYFCAEHILSFCPETLQSAIQAAGFELVKTAPVTPDENKDVGCVFRKVRQDSFWRGMRAMPERAGRLADAIRVYVRRRQEYIAGMRRRFEEAGLFDPSLRVGVYGAGGHTEQMLEGVPELRTVRFFFDSDPAKRGRPFLGGAIHSPEEIPTLGLDAVLISSRAFEEEILAALTRTLPSSIRVIPMYREFGERS